MFGNSGGVNIKCNALCLLSSTAEDAEEKFCRQCRRGRRRFLSNETALKGSSVGEFVKQMFGGW